MKHSALLILCLATSNAQDTESHFHALCDVTRNGAVYSSIPCRLDNGGTEIADDVYLYAPGVWGRWSITLDLSSGPWPWLAPSMQLSQPRIADYTRTEKNVDGSTRASALLWGSVVVHPLDATFRRQFAAAFADLVSRGIAPFENRCQNFWVTVTGTKAVIWFEESIDDTDGFHTPTQAWLDRHARDFKTYGGAKPRTLSPPK